MNIAVVAANGKVGQLVVEQAKARGFNVTAIGRGENKTAATTYIQKDLMDLTAEDLAGFDVVVDAFGVWEADKQHLHTDTSQHLANLLSNTPTRLIIVGGAGSLYMDDTHTTRLMDGPDFPAEYFPIAKAMADALDAMRARHDVRWTMISPAADFRADGPALNTYTLAGEVFTLSSAGDSVISYADYATALIDEIEHGNHIQERISVVNT